MSQSHSRRIVVTGGSGFLGGRVCRKLSEHDYEVIPLGSRDYDLTDQSQVRALYRKERPDILIHIAAACGGIGANVENPGWFLYANSVMGLLLLEEGRKANLEQFILVSTTCAYPEQAPMPLREEYLWDGKPTEATAPYGIAKRMLHEACSSYEKQYGLKSQVLIPANMYGPGDHFDPKNSHVIAALVRRYVEAVDNQEPEVVNWGSGLATREFLHVDDAAEAIRLGVETPKAECGPMNIGTGRETSIRELAETVAEATGYQGPTNWDTSKPDGQPRRCLDVSRAHETLGFQARIGLEAGIAETVDWFREKIKQ